jgi:hypothetical protein
MVKINDVIQLDPAQSPWGALLCIVSEVKAWGVQCYALVPRQRDEPPGSMYLRVETGKFQVIGMAEWIVGSASTEDPESA